MKSGKSETASMLPKRQYNWSIYELIGFSLAKASLYRIEYAFLWKRHFLLFECTQEVGEFCCPWQQLVWMSCS
jgi:hypothetical protein